MPPAFEIDRREFVLTALGASGGLLVGCRAAPDRADGARGAVSAAATASTDRAADRPSKFGVWIEISPGGTIVVTCPQSEMGQGVMNAVARIVADELDADWSAIDVVLADARDEYINPISKRHRTANSESIAIHFDLLRTAGAAARELLVAAAAQRWGVPREECKTEAATIAHAGSARSLRYAEVAAEAAALPAPTQPRLKARNEFRIIGREWPNKLVPAKCDGSAVFGIDVRVPEMLYAALARSPAVSSNVKSFDATAALAMPGVVAVVQVADGVAAIATSTWRAFKAAEAIGVVYDEQAARAAHQSDIDARLRAALADEANALPGMRGRGQKYDRAAHDAALAAAQRKLIFDYEVPFLAHAALEPLCCTVRVADGECEVWAPTQQPDRAREAVAQVTGVARDNVVLHMTLLGGGFGRKWELDFVRQAAQIATHVRGRPVKLTWTREQDFRHDRFRSAHRARTRVGLDATGGVVAIHTRSTGIDMWKYQKRAPIPGVADPFATGLLVNDAYGLPNPYVDFVAVDLPIPVGTWRSVSASMNGFFCESAIDDIAAATRRDPLAYRKQLLANSPRALAVLALVAEKSGWAQPLPRGRGRGIALALGFGSICAEVVEVSVRAKQIRIEKITCAFDCGIVVDPSMLRAQIEGGIVWGLSAARDGRIAFENGVAQATNFHESPVLRLNECPPIDVHVVDSGEKPSGAGEASVPPVAPALAAAIFAATGQRPRRLPLVADGWTFD
jgi:isoquinoline 1-oxidoreductase subunit beta